MPGLDEVSFDRHSRTLVLAIRSGCKYCTADLPFYASLAQIRASQARGDKPRLVVVTSDERSQIDRYLSDAGVVADQVIAQKNPADLRLAATPVVLLVGSDRRIQEVWRGELDDRREQSVVNAFLGR